MACILVLGARGRNPRRGEDANDAEEFERYGPFKKSKARVAMLNALNFAPVFGTTSMMDFSQVVYDRLSDETLENDGEALFQKISSYGRSFITMKVQAVDDEGNKVSLDGSVFKAQQCVEWPEALGKSTHLRFVMLVVRSFI